MLSFTVLTEWQQLTTNLNLKWWAPLIIYSLPTIFQHISLIYIYISVGVSQHILGSTSHLYSWGFIPFFQYNVPPKLSNKKKNHTEPKIPFLFLPQS